MQTLLMLRPTDDEPINRIINIELMSTANVDPNDENRTVVYCAGVEIKLGIPFEKFLKSVEHLVAENYRIGNETSIAWHKKRISDQEEMMKTVMKEFHQ